MAIEEKCICAAPVDSVPSSFVLQVLSLGHPGAPPFKRVACRMGRGWRRSVSPQGRSATTPQGQQRAGFRFVGRKIRLLHGRPHELLDMVGKDACVHRHARLSRAWWRQSCLASRKCRAACGFKCIRHFRCGSYIELSNWRARLRRSVGRRCRNAGAFDDSRFEHQFEPACEGH